MDSLQLVYRNILLRGLSNMRLSELIEQLQEIEKQYKKIKLDVMIVNNFLVIRQIIKDSDCLHEAKLIETVEIK